MEKILMWIITPFPVNPQDSQGSITSTILINKDKDYIVMIKPLLETLRTPVSKVDKPISPPIWFMRQAGRYLPEYRAVREKAGGFWEMCYNPDYICEITTQPIKRFGMDGAIVFSDILVIPKALGQEIVFQENHGPLLSPLAWNRFFQTINWQKMEDHLSPLYEGIQKIKNNVPSSCTTIGFAGSPWTLATYMIDLGKEKEKDLKFRKSLEAIQEKEILKDLLPLLTQAVIQHSKNQIKAGAEALQLFDSWAQIVPEKDQEWVLWSPLKEIIENLQEAYPEVPLIYFGKGLSAFYKDLHKKHPNLRFSVDYDADLNVVKESLWPYTVIQGNLSPDVLLKGGEELATTVKKLLETFGYGSYVFNLGHGILPSTPIEHVEMVLEQVRAHGK